MGLKDEIRSQMKAAMKDKKTVERDILRLALSEIEAAEATKGETLSDDASEKIIRKMIKSNEETKAAAGDRAEMIAKLTTETAVLDALLPKLWDVAQIIAALPEDDIKAAASDGQATGVAMKHLKSAGAPVDGKTVSEAVRKIRA